MQQRPDNNMSECTNGMIKDDDWFREQFRCSCSLLSSAKDQQYTRRSLWNNSSMSILSCRMTRQGQQQPAELQQQQQQHMSPLALVMRTTWQHQTQQLDCQGYMVQMHSSQSCLTRSASRLSG
jgi:hypothetical protein